MKEPNLWMEYICNQLIVAGDGGDSFFLSDDVERESEGVAHLFEEVGVVTKILTFE